MFEMPPMGQAATSSSPAAVAASAGHLEEARRLVADAIGAHNPYLRFWKFPAWRGIWSDQESAALLRNSALFR